MVSSPRCLPHGEDIGDLTPLGGVIVLYALPHPFRRRCQMKDGRFPPEEPSAQTLLGEVSPETVAAFLDARRAVLVRRSSDVHCYCESLIELIRFDLEHGRVPATALIKACCWRQICRVRGSYPDSVDGEGWTT